jgi:hypothetical protein
MIIFLMDITIPAGGCIHVCFTDGKYRKCNGFICKCVVVICAKGYMRMYTSIIETILLNDHFFMKVQYQQ